MEPSRRSLGSGKAAIGASVAFRLRQLDDVHRPFVANVQGPLRVELIRSGYPPAMASICPNLPHETDSEIAETEAKWELACRLGAKVPAACLCGEALFTPAMDGLGRPRLEYALGPCWVILEPVDRLPREASRLGDRAD
jgi:hypothetical protein